MFFSSIQTGKSVQQIKYLMIYVISYSFSYVRIKVNPFSNIYTVKYSQLTLILKLINKKETFKRVVHVPYRARRCTVQYND